MVSHTQSQIDTENWLDLVKLFAAMGEYAATGTTHQERAIRSLQFLKSRPRDQRFQLLDLVSDRVTPATSSAVATQAGEGRSAIGGI